MRYADAPKYIKDEIKYSSFTDRSAIECMKIFKQIWRHGTEIMIAGDSTFIWTRGGMHYYVW